MKPFTTTFRVPVYKSRVRVVIADSQNEMLTVLPKKFQFIPEDENEGFVDPPKGGVFLLALTFGSLSHNLIGHEIAHLTSFILRYHEVSRSEEAFAYLNGEMHEKIYRILHQQKIQIKV